MNDSSETKIVATRTVSTVADLLAFLEDNNVYEETKLAFPVVHLVEEIQADGSHVVTLDIDYDDEVEEEAEPQDEATPTTA